MTMQFRTITQIKPFDRKIDHSRQILSLGSCFADNMAQHLMRAKFNVTASPTGILFNPESIADAIAAFDNLNDDKATTIECPSSNKTITFDSLNADRIGGTPDARHKELTESDLEYADGRYFNYDFHSAFSATDAAEALHAMNIARERGAQALRSADTVIITFGTAWVYRLVRDGHVAANCHKQPQKLFEREMLTVQQITDQYIALMRGPLAGKNVIFTVSPVRHLADGLEQNSLSKAVLRIAVARITEACADACYFPSFEIQNDELRDYRFYADDMTHPSTMAVEYIWERFVETAISETAQKIMQRTRQIADAAAHRPFDASSEAHRRFCRKMLDEIDALQSEYAGMNFEEEKRYFASFL